MSSRYDLFSRKPTFAMEAHNGLSAIIAERAGFQAVWASGLSIASAMGMRDCNEVAWTDIVAITKQMTSVVSVPVIVDGDSGYGNYNNVIRFTSEIGKAGGAAICYEDKQFPKMNSFITSGMQQLATCSEFCGKIKAAKDAGGGFDIRVIARTEALIVGASMQEALDRAHAYVEAGADAILIHSKRRDSEQIREFTSYWNGTSPVVVVPTTYSSVPTAELLSYGVNTIIWANHNLRACAAAMMNCCSMIRDRNSVEGVENQIIPLSSLFELLDYDQLERNEQMYADHSATQRG